MGERQPSVAAIVACVDGERRVLLVLQTSGPFAENWLLPGGRVEPGEAPADAARRELREETGLVARDVQAAALYEVRGIAPNAFHMLVHLFRADEVSGSLRPEAGGAVRWARASDETLHPSLARELADLGLLEHAPTDMDVRAAGLELLRRLS